jgi:hypothetical protein
MLLYSPDLLTPLFIPKRQPRVPYYPQDQKFSKTLVHIYPPVPVNLTQFTKLQELRLRNTRLYQLRLYPGFRHLDAEKSHTDQCTTLLALPDFRKISTRAYYSLITSYCDIHKPTVTAKDTTLTNLITLNDTKEH